jgi:hypothetical protein
MTDKRLLRSRKSQAALYLRIPNSRVNFDRSHSSKRRDKREEVGATSDVVVDEALVARLVSKVLQWICPQQVAHESVRRRLSEPVNL